MLTAGVAVWRAWQAAGGADAGSAGRTQPRRIHGAGRRGCARVPRRRAARALSRAGDAGGGAAPATGAMAAILGADDDAVAAACRKAARRPRRRAGQLQRAGAARDRGRARGRRARDAGGEGARRASARVMLPVSAPFHSSLLQAGGGEARAKARAGPVRVAVDPGRCTTSTSREHATPDAIRAALARAGGEPGALDADDPGVRRARRDARRRMRARQGAREPRQAHRRRARRRSR